MTYPSELETGVAGRIAKLLSDQGGSWSPSERAEVERYLRAGEYGLALDTLSWILVEEKKPISRDALGEIESLADVMQLAQEPFVDAVRASVDQQTAGRRSAR